MPPARAGDGVRAPSGSPMLKPILFLAVSIACVWLAAAGYTLWQTGRIAARFPPAGQFVQTDGGRIHLTRRAPASPQAVVILLHGASGNEAEMRVALAEPLLARGFEVISIDRPGHGWSERQAGGEASSPAAQARIVRAAAERIGVDRAIVVAHSLAGAVGLQLALDHADFISGAVLIGPVTHPWSGGVAAYYSLAASWAGGAFTRALALPLGQALAPAAIASVFSPEAPPPDYLARTGIELVLRPRNFLANARDVASLHAFVSEQWPRYGSIAVPVAIVAGDRDQIVSTDIHARPAQRQIPGASLHIMQGGGHAPHWSRPDAVVDAAAEVARWAGLIAVEPGVSGSH